MPVVPSSVLNINKIEDRVRAGTFLKNTAHAIETELPFFYEVGIPVFFLLGPPAYDLVFTHHIFGDIYVGGGFIVVAVLAFGTHTYLAMTSTICSFTVNYGPIARFRSEGLMAIGILALLTSFVHFVVMQKLDVDTIKSYADIFLCSTCAVILASACFVWNFRHKARTLFMKHANDIYKA